LDSFIDLEFRIFPNRIKNKYYASKRMPLKCSNIGTDGFR